jgi:hypothetical protein
MVQAIYMGIRHNVTETMEGFQKSERTVAHWEKSPERLYKSVLLEREASTLFTGWVFSILNAIRADQTQCVICSW